jgi:lactoylglutathione lyase
MPPALMPYLNGPPPIGFARTSRLAGRAYAAAPASYTPPNLERRDGRVFRKVDCLQLSVPDLESGLAFYRGRLGHELIWRTDTALGLRLTGSPTKLVLQTERPAEVDLTVADTHDAVAKFVAARGRVLVEPFDIPIGKCAVVEDPWGNQLVLLDTSNGLLVTDSSGNVLLDDEGRPKVS